MPLFKFFITAEHLEKFDLTYETEAEKQAQTNSITGTAPNKKTSFEKNLDKVMRHFVVGTELSIGKNLTFRFGYNYRRRQEMKISTKPGMVGFSWGWESKFLNSSLAMAVRLITLRVELIIFPSA